jgi:Flp pilus assembly protein TadG
VLYRRNDRGLRTGVAAAELALLLPVLCLLLVAAVDFARLYYAYTTITNCAENAALWATNPYSNGTITPSQTPYASAAAAGQADAYGLSPLPTVAVAYSSTVNGTYSSTRLTRGYVKVTVTWTFTPITHYLSYPTTLSRTVYMRILSNS